MEPRDAPSHRWRLMLGGELMAELSYDSYAFPWISVAVQPGPGLAPFLPYFGDATAWRDDDPALDAMLDQVAHRGGFRLFDGDRREIAPFTLVNLDGSSGDLRF